MKPPVGPTKKLAPTASLSASCPHSYSEDEGVQLEIDCSECSGAHDLENTQCVTGVLNVISSGAEPEAIVLKRFTHKRYRGEVIRQIALVAAELSALNRASAAAESLSDKRCRTCSASSERIIAEMRQRLLRNPIEYLSHKGTMISAIEGRTFTNACENAQSCVHRALRASIVWRGRH